MPQTAARRTSRKTPARAIVVGPEHDGQRMSLAEFDTAEGKPGYLYELSRGTITVTNVPDWPHQFQVHAAHQQFSAHLLRHPEQIALISEGSGCKVLLSTLQSERHPDLSIYTDFPPAGAQVWATWIAAIVLEIVSKGSEQRDYVEKREEYLQFGVREYWILDAAKGEMLVLRRQGGAWTEHVLRPPQLYRTPLLPGLKFSCGRVFKAAKKGSR